MKFDNPRPVLFFASLVLVTGIVAHGQDSKPSPEYSDQAEIAAIQRTAKEVPHFNLGTVIGSAAEANMVGVRSENVTFSRRLDSRTYFAQDRRFGVTREAGVFAGSNDELQKLAASVMSNLRIPAA